MSDAETVHIKKYGNRRFYSSKDKAYITLAEIQALVMKGHRIQVLEADSQRDITSEILTQILLEQGRATHFPVELLEKMIRMNEKTIRNIWTPIVEHHLKVMAQMSEVALAGLKMLSGRAAPQPEKTKTKKS